MKKLEYLLNDLNCKKAIRNKNIFIEAIVDDSRKIQKNNLFVAIKGLTVDGHKFIPQAIANGATVIIGEKDLKIKSATYIRVKNSRKALGQLAAIWYENPSRKLKMIGITGTDGKTTTANIIYWILKNANKKVGLISTVSAKIGDQEYDTGFHVTNPEPLALQKFLKKMVDEDCEYAVLEVTSHGLDQQRVAGIDFAIAVLTNITPEHLDYHKTMQNYIKTKAKLFNMPDVVILNKDDSSFIKIRKHIDFTDKEEIDYSFNNIDKKIADVIKTRFSEVYNYQNAAAAVAVARKLNIADEDIIKAIITFPSVTGRMEKIENKKGLNIIVDFAHTPNSLSNVLEVLRKQLSKNNKLVCVFGCAGERDIKKRNTMPQISVKLADLSIFTAEDPRGEKVEDILKVMEKAARTVTNHKKLICIKDRGNAIYQSINKYANKGDAIVICGKGHEKSMNYNGVEYPWSDQEAVTLALNGKILELR